MAEKLEAFTEKITGYTLEKPERKPQQNYINILILRELQSAARFTTDGLEANSAVIRIGEIEETVGKLFGRKQVASDRRIAKALQRTLIQEKMNAAVNKGTWEGCSMAVNQMCQRCPECALFGSAASDEGISITSRVMYDEARSVPSARLWRSTPERARRRLRKRGYICHPGTRLLQGRHALSRVVTLRDVTPEEVLFFLNVTDRNARYGATGTRFGKTRNHILGVYASHREGPSSLEVTRGVAVALAREAAADDEDSSDLKEHLREVMTADTLSLESVIRAAIQVYEDLAEKRGLLT